MWKHPLCLPDKHFNCLFLLEWAFWVCISSYVSENSRLPYWPLPLPEGEGSLQDLEEIQLLESLDSWHIYSLNHCIFSSSPRLWNDHEWRRSCVISIRFQASHSYKHIDLLSHEFPMLWRIPSCFTTFLIASLSRFTAKGLTYAGTSLFRIILQIFLNSNTSAFNFSRLFLVSLFMLFGPCFQHLVFLQVHFLAYGSTRDFLCKRFWWVDPYCSEVSSSMGTLVMSSVWIRAFKFFNRIRPTIVCNSIDRWTQNFCQFVCDFMLQQNFSQDLPFVFQSSEQSPWENDCEGSWIKAGCYEFS